MEIWKDIVSYEGLYQVSDQGRVRSLDRIVEQPHSRFPVTMRRIYRGKVLSPRRGDYLNVGLHKENQEFRQHVHLLVLETFKGMKPPDKDEARHLNGNSYDNRLENLDWGTYQEQKADQRAHKTFFVPEPPRGEAHHKAKLSDDAVVAIRHARQIKVPAKALAEYFNVTRSLIYQIANRTIRKDV